MSSWDKLTHLDPHKFICGYCGYNIASKEGYSLVTRRDSKGKELRKPRGIYICPNCDEPTLIRYNSTTSAPQIPGPLFGRSVENLPDNISILYQEARQCCGSGLYNASILLCRILVMHIAVERGAEEGRNFVHYTEYLTDKGYVPKNDQNIDWLDEVRHSGNELNHEIQLKTSHEAAVVFSFVETLLFNIYDLPTRSRSPSTTDRYTSVSSTPY